MEKDSFKPIPDPTSKRRQRLLFKYDAERGLIEIKGYAGLVVVNLLTGEVTRRDVGAPQQI
jgi:hypothetical protein